MAQTTQDASFGPVLLVLAATQPDSTCHCRTLAEPK